MINWRTLGPIAFVITVFTPIAASVQAETGNYYDMKRDSDYFESRTQTSRVTESPMQSRYSRETASKREDESPMGVAQPEMSSSPSTASADQGKRSEDR
ncbi:hypothetical protein [Allochromatium palmeri]|uniref:Uncharacterized protein n=1 Tax=Allochromatium palmeri TaxID=231048 RepID=A0A6N8EBW4_9GAMM|nr:hypothetical protein [Allochromatium palmeri]MTW21071.1 hypothetical protein [Allochromatium palmeri]